MSKAASARAKFAELRALRASGKKRIDTYEVEDEIKLYEEVDEDGYKKVVRERLNQDDFVIDDNGEGYADDGREEWDRPVGYGSESEEELPVKGKAGKAGMLQSSTHCAFESPLIKPPQRSGNAKKTRPKRRTRIKGSAIISQKAW